jgi:hypothetical protein
MRTTLTLAALVVTASAAAQPENVNVGGQLWKPAEPTVSDLGPLNTSQRVMPLDMRATSSFDKLYKLDARPRFFGDRAQGEYYMRRSGAVSAVFPRSSYRALEEGVLAEVPAGTVFSLGGDIGRLIDAPPPAPRRNIFSAQPVNPRNEPAPTNPNRPDYRVPQGPPAPPAAPARADRPRRDPAELVYPGPDEPLARSIWTDEGYRRERVSALLDQALAGK